MGRIMTIFRAIFNTILGRAESARYDDLLDLSYEDLCNELVKVQQGLVEVATSKNTANRQLTEAQAQILTLNTEASAAYDGTPEGEALAGRILAHKADLQTEIGTLQAEFAGLNTMTEELKEDERNLKTAIERFSRRKEAMKGSHRAAKAAVEARETMAGISGRLGSSARVIGRMEAQTQMLKDKNTSLKELTAAGNLPDFTMPQGTTHLDREIAESKNRRAIQADLEALKAGKELSTSPVLEITQKSTKVEVER